MNRKTLTLILGAVASLAALPASAAFVLGLPVDPNDPTVDVEGVLIGVGDANGPTPTEIETALGFSIGTKQFKFQYDGDPKVYAEFETLKDFYTGAFTPNDGEGTASITFDGPSYLAQPKALLAKDGNQGHYIFDLRGWDGIKPIEIRDLWPDKGSFSHVEFYGTGVAIVPEPSTYVAGALLGLPFAVGLLRRVRRGRAQA